MTALLERARTLAPELVALRRELHRHPELSFQEFRTSARVAEELEAMGLPARTGVGRTGVIAELRGTLPGPTIALRADMDALPIQEATGASYASTVPGVMHACGHDAHTSILLGAARLLVERARETPLQRGRIRFLFQPSEEAMDEEGKSGATRMIEDGAMDGVNAVLGLHVWSHLPAGTVFVREGPVMAGADEIFVEVLGRSSHAARPHEGVDAIVLAAQGILAAQTVVSRGISPFSEGVVSLGTIQGGVANNVLADRVRIHGTLRYFEEEVRTRLQEGVRRAFAVADALGGEARVTIRPGYPPVVNDPKITQWVADEARKLLGAGAVQEAEQVMGAEDFAFLARRAAGSFLHLGAALSDPREHHHPRFDIDEAVLPLGAALLAGGAVRLLEEL